MTQRDRMEAAKFAAKFGAAVYEVYWEAPSVRGMGMVELYAADWVDAHDGALGMIPDDATVLTVDLAI